MARRQMKTFNFLVCSARVYSHKKSTISYSGRPVLFRMYFFFPNPCSSIILFYFQAVTERQTTMDVANPLCESSVVKVQRAHLKLLRQYTLSIDDLLST